VHLLPRHGIGIVVMATGASVGWQCIDGTLALLREAGLFDHSRTAPVSRPLLEAQATIDRLLEHWDAELVARTFDRQSLQYAWLQSLRDDLATLKREHGNCRATGAPRSRSGSEATWQAACERGAVEFNLLLAPGASARIQMIEWRDLREPVAEEGATCAE
jgi:hypothetical protein